VFCQLETLRRCFPSSIRQILNELPTTLDETYERTLSEIPEEKWKQAHRLFQCLIVASCPLRIDELAEVLAIRFESETTADLIKGWRPENTEDAVLSACSSLIAVVEVDGSPVVQFSHFSVKEFLTSDRLATAQSRNVSRYHIPLEPAHKILAQACLGTLLDLDEHIDKNRLKNYPLAFYAAHHWFEHARFGDVSFSICDSMGQLFDPGKPHFSAWIWIRDVGQRKRSIEDLAERPSQPEKTPLYYSALCGLRSVAEQLITIYPNDINSREGSRWSPLRGAVRKGHLDVARLLLEHGAFPNHVVGSWTLLHDTSYNNNIDAIGLLLEHGADMHCMNDSGQTPLHLASGNGSVKAMEKLLEYGADLNIRMDYGWTPLHRASANGRPEGVRLLLRHGANVNDKDDIVGDTALHQASREGRLEIMQALLECGADVHARNKSNWTPFKLASERGHHDVAQLLLEHGAEVE
jgi:ankyrin repeat protein